MSYIGGYAYISIIYGKKLAFLYNKIKIIYFYVDLLGIIS